LLNQREMYPVKLNIEPTKRSPWVVLEQGKMFIMGRSIIENPGVFFEPVHKWVSGRAKGKPDKIRIDLGFDYVNTGSIKWLYILLRDLSEMNGIFENAVINWYYEQGDDDMCELGFILRSLVDCPFTIIEVDEMNGNLYRELLQKES
jgi:hypothetical protein